MYLLIELDMDSVRFEASTHIEYLDIVRKKANRVNSRNLSRVPNFSRVVKIYRIRILPGIPCLHEHGEGKINDATRREAARQPENCASSTKHSIIAGLQESERLAMWNHKSVRLQCLLAH